MAKGVRGAKEVAAAEVAVVAALLRAAMVVEAVEVVVEAEAVVAVAENKDFIRRRQAEAALDPTMAAAVVQALAHRRTPRRP